MALTEDEVQICNLALGRIGGFTLDYDDSGSGNSGMAGNVANKCLIHYEHTRNVLLRSAYWNFAAKRINLVGSWATETVYTTDQYVWVDSVLYKCNEAHTSSVWNTDYVYLGDELVYLGDDLVRDDRIDFKWDMVVDEDAEAEFEYAYKYAVPSDFSRLKPKYLEDEGIMARLEGGYIITDETELSIKYVRKVTDPDDFDPLFKEVLVLDLAMNLLYPLAGTKTQDLKMQLKMERKEAMSRARAVCASEDNIKDRTYDWVNVRYTSGKV